MRYIDYANYDEASGVAADPLAERDAKRAKQVERDRSADPSVSFVSSSGGYISWPQPRPLTDGVALVTPFDLDFRPASVAPWVADIAERMQCPPDFVAIPAIVALGAVLGRKIGVRPQRQTDWIEVP